MANRQDKIDRQYLILCEGLDAYNFLREYLNSNALNGDIRFNTAIQILNFGGISQLQSYIKHLKKMEYYLDVNHILVVRDAEINIESAEDAVKAAFRNNGLSIPLGCNQWCNGEPKTAYTLFPACCEPLRLGALEDLCWNILSDTNAHKYREDVEIFLNRMKEKYRDLTIYEHKGRLHTYFSVKDDFVSLKVGEAARAGAFDWNHECLLPLRRLIEEGFMECS